MNVENLNKMINMLRCVNPEYFDMDCYCRIDYNTCNTVQCIVGLAAELFSGKKITDGTYKDDSGNVLDFDYYEWSIEFTGLKDERWAWCFHGGWSNIDNTIEGGIKRLKYIIEKGRVPKFFDYTSLNAAALYPVEMEKTYKEWFKEYKPY